MQRRFREQVQSTCRPNHELNEINGFGQAYAPRPDLLTFDCDRPVQCKARCQRSEKLGGEGGAEGGDEDRGCIIGSKKIENVLSQERFQSMIGERNREFAAPLKSTRYPHDQYMMLF